MKIIGTTPGGYLVEAAGIELANAAGYRIPSEAPGWVRTGPPYSYEGHFKVGAEFKPSVAFAYMQTLREKESRVADSRAMLLALAEMLQSALPSTVIPPADPEPAIKSEGDAA